MAWKIDDERVMPFLSADERRDVEAVLCRMPMAGLVFREEEAGVGTATTPGPQAGKWKDYKDGKDSKENKDYKDGKDSKDWKDSKDGKDTKDYKDYKDGKDSKDHKDFDYALASVCETRQFTEPGPELSVSVGIEVADAEDDVVTVLRNSRVNRYLRRAGLVI